jgi:hypothetical protein
VPPSKPLDRDALLERVPSGPRWTPAQIMAAHPVSFQSAPVPALERVQGMTELLASPLALKGPEIELLGHNGFVLAPRLARGNFLTGYTEIYVRDQPVYVTADLILNALHESFDALVADIEADALAPSLDSALVELRVALGGPEGRALTPEAGADLDAYLAVTLGLLRNAAIAPVAGADAAAVEALRKRFTAAEGAGAATLFGRARDVDFSQMKPRGHYAGVPERERFFRAVMFLGREGLRLIDVQNGVRKPDRRQLRAALGMLALATPAVRATMARIESTMGAFAGEAEALTFTDLDALSRKLDGASGLSKPDANLLAAIDAVRGQRPRVATSLLVHPEGFRGTAPQPVPFSLTPQRYTPDAFVLTNVTFDRVNGGEVMRMMPETLDAAFGALGNDQALALLAKSLAAHDYATELETAHVLVDAHEASYWTGSLYASWLASLRALSPRETLADTKGLTGPTRSEPWGRRLLSAQLSAWSELRHDLVLYVAQSYTGEVSCSYPAAYVDPYPEFWSALQAWASQARTLVAAIPWKTVGLKQRWWGWTAHALDVVTKLGAIAQRERAGLEPTPDQLAWVNEALNAREVSVVCTTVLKVDGGWLYHLYAPAIALHEWRGIVADLHTQPSDEGGRRVGRVLHAGTGMPQAMAVIAGPEGHERVYVGYVYQYLERVTTGFDRLTDERWRAEQDKATAPLWLAPITAPAK